MSNSRIDDFFRYRWLYVARERAERVPGTVQVELPVYADLIRLGADELADAPYLAKFLFRLSSKKLMKISQSARWSIL